MSKWYVCVDHLGDDELELFGFYRVRNGDEFTVYRAGGYGDEQIVKNSHKFLLVDDINDAKKMGDFLVIAPKRHDLN